MHKDKLYQNNSKYINYAFRTFGTILSFSNMFPCWRFFVLPDLKPPEVACTAEADGGLLSTQAQIDVTRRLINTSATEAPLNCCTFCWKVAAVWKHVENQRLANVTGVHCILAVARSCWYKMRYPRNDGGHLLCMQLKCVSDVPQHEKS